MKLLVQPSDGIAPILAGIRKAKKQIEIVIFRFDRSEIEKALVEAVERGVSVHALIAFTNKGGEKRLRDLETEFLARGITVARTAGDLVRYHGKMMLVDGSELYLLAFNFTRLDIDHSRSFGLVTRNPKLVQEAARLFEADTRRQPFTARHSRLVVSPVNAREQLAKLIRGAKRELLIYDPKVSDKNFLRLLRERAAAGVKVRVIGECRGGDLPVRRLGTRLHARVILRDGSEAFVGSQSLRRLELDSRREIGVIFHDKPAVAALRRIFQEDWAGAERVKRDKQAAKLPVKKAAKKVAHVVTKKLPIEPIARRVSKEIRRNGHAKLSRKQVEKTVRLVVENSVRPAVEKVAKKAVAEVLEEAG